MKAANSLRAISIILIVILVAISLLLYSGINETLQLFKVAGAQAKDMSHLYIFLGIIVLTSLFLFAILQRVISLQLTRPHNENNLATDNYNTNFSTDDYFKQNNNEEDNNTVDENLISEKSLELGQNIINDVLEYKTDAKMFSEMLLTRMSKDFEIVQGMLFMKNTASQKFKMEGVYAFYSESKVTDFSEGEGISGQVVKNKSILYVTNVPENYITVLSGTGEGSPKYLYFIPTIHNDVVNGLIEVASFSDFPKEAEPTFKHISELTGKFIAENYVKE